VQHSVPYVHTQNDLAESLIKRFKLIARSLLQDCNLSTSCWGHAVLHVVDLVQLRPTASHITSPLQLVCGDQPSISYLWNFGCVVYTLISPPKRTSTSPHRRMGIYMGFQSLFILKYLEPLTSDLFMARFSDCIFNEDHFLILGEIINLSLMVRKLIGMTSLSYPQTHVQRRLDFKFRKF
jgi:hypothetical protein